MQPSISMSTRFQSLDKALLAAVTAGAAQFAALCTEVRAVAVSLATDDRGHSNWELLVARRLQALRKAGLLQYTKGQWRLASGIRATTSPSSRPEAPVRVLTVRSRHVADYLLLNLDDKTAWRPVERDAQDATWISVPNPVTVLSELAEGRITHLNRGSCPDPINGEASRDRACSVCCALLALMPPTRTA